MGFKALLGNERLKDNLRRSISRGRASHFYLICGPEGSGKHTLATLLSAALLCKEEDAPCGHCAACRKVMANTHPDFITVNDPEHKTLPVDMIRDMRDDLFIRPNEAMWKIYIFPQDLRVEGMNALLKILEEPPSYGVFLLLSDNPEKLLPTIRSRSTELVLNALPEQVLRKVLSEKFPQADEAQLSGAIARSGGYLGQAQALLEKGTAIDPQTQEFARCFAAKDTIGLLQVLVPMEKWKRDQVLPVFTQWVQLLESALTSRYGMQALSPAAQALSTSRSSQELTNAIRQLQKAIEYTQGNVSVAAVCGYLEWALR